MNATVLSERDDYMDDIETSLETFKKGYFNWLCSNIDVEGIYDEFVADILFRTPFECVLEYDEHRISDGLDLRDQYTEVSGEILESTDISWPCSVLEIMVSLAMSMDYVCDDDVLDCEDRIGYFYHEMLNNLGIGHEFPGSWESREKLIDKVIDKFLDRRYGKDGSGGLFPLKRPREDQREVELWYQMNAYMIENY